MTSQNAESYLRWRGDVTLAADPFNEVDNLVFSSLAYLDFSPLPEAATPVGISLKEALKRLSGNLHSKGFTDAPGTFLNTVCDSKRFGDTVLRNYEDVIEKGGELGTQFCAMEFVLPNGASYVSFRGTDTTLVGWREDFEISFRRVSAQARAVSYLERVVVEARDYYVGGHSKGANLALYATSLLKDTHFSRIRCIYLNDGPGICKDVLNVTWADSYAKKVVRISPEYSVFGRLFSPPFPVRVVRSANSGVMEHDLMSWQVADGTLDYASAFDAQSEFIASTLSDWLDGVSTEKREAFVDELFAGLEAGGATTIKDLSGDGQMHAIIERLAQAKAPAKETAFLLPARMAFGRVIDSLRDLGLVQWLIEDQLAHGLELLGLGLFFFFKKAALPLATSALLGGLLAALLVDTLIRLKRLKWNYELMRTRLYVCVGALVLFVTTLVKQDALFVYGSVLLAAALLISCSSYAHAAFAVRKDRLGCAINAVFAVLMGLSGLFILVAPESVMAPYEMALGVTFFACGAVQVVDALRTDAKARMR